MWRRERGEVGENWDSVPSALTVTHHRLGPARRHGVLDEESQDPSRLEKRSWQVLTRGTPHLLCADIESHGSASTRGGSNASGIGGWKSSECILEPAWLELVSMTGGS